MVKKKLTPFLIVLSILVLSIMFFTQQNTEKLPIIKVFEGKANSFAIYTEDGDILYANMIGEIKKSMFNNIVVKTDKFTIKNPIGIVENPPSDCITSIKNMVLESLNMNNKILIIYIDGLGYELYEKAIKLDNIPYMASLNIGTKALTVYPPITDVAFASMVTGETPKYTGIHSREKNALLVPTIFDIASQNGKNSKIIEGNIKILTSDAPTILNIDENKNGTIDDEIYKSAMEEIQNPPHIFLVHFHSYDDMGHKYGPSSQEALAQLTVLDSYIEDIVNSFTGDVIITSDHGMHNEKDGGSHGAFSSLDMFIPIILKTEK